MATMQFDLVSPERKLASFEVTQVQIPGAEGDMTAMPDHMPVITTLRPGVVKAQTGGEDREFVVTGGFAEITAGSISVLAEVAVSRADADAAFMDELQQALEQDGASDEMAKRASDVAALRMELGV